MDQLNMFFSEIVCRVYGSFVEKGKLEVHF